MTTDVTAPRSRRAILAGAAGGLAALVAQALGRPAIVRAGSDGDVVLGAPNTTTGNTRIENTGTGVGFVGISGSSIGVNGVSELYIGARGQSKSWIGVYGVTSATDQPATVGQASFNSSGVLGFSGGGDLPAAPGKTGVYGYAAQDGYAAGVLGESGFGDGVRGKSTDPTHSGVGATTPAAASARPARAPVGRPGPGCGARTRAAAGASSGPAPAGPA